MSDKLILFNAALRHCEVRKLASLTENVKAQYTLNDIWDNGFVDRILKGGQWNFAQRTVKLTPSPDIEAEFGYQNAFIKPEDYIRKLGLATDEFMSNNLNNYEDEAGVFYSDDSVLYIKYVSNDLSYGNNTGLWPEWFTEWVELRLAKDAAPMLTHSDRVIARIEEQEESARKGAKNLDAMEGPSKMAPKGSWVHAREGGRSAGDRGSRNKLIG
jgi:hypothetical protein